MALVILMGIPASGKSRLAEALKSRLSPIIHVQYDSFVPSNCQDAQWKQCREVVRDACELLLSRITGKEHCIQDSVIKVRDAEIGTHDVLKTMSSNQMDLNSETVIVIDDNMYYQSMRYEYYQLARRYGVGFCTVHVRCPTDVAIERNKSRLNPVPEATILKMAGLLEEPQPIKNHWEVMSFAVGPETEPMSMDILIQVIKAAVSNPVQYIDDSAERAQDRETCSKSVLHRADKALRKLVAKGMSEAKSGMPEKSDAMSEKSEAEVGMLGKSDIKVDESKKSMANPKSSASQSASNVASLGKQLSLTKHEVMAAFRNGELHVPSELSEAIQNNADNADEKLEEFLSTLFYIRIEAKNKK